MRSSLGLIGDKLTRMVTFNVAVMRLFRNFDFVMVTVEKPDSQRQVVVKSKRNLIARSDNTEYSLPALFQNAGRSMFRSFSVIVFCVIGLKSFPEFFVGFFWQASRKLVIFSKHPFFPVEFFALRNSFLV